MNLLAYARGSLELAGATLVYILLAWYALGLSFLLSGLVQALFPRRWALVRTQFLYRMVGPLFPRRWALDRLATGKGWEAALWGVALGMATSPTGKGLAEGLEELTDRGASPIALASFLAASHNLTVYYWVLLSPLLGKELLLGHLWGGAVFIAIAAGLMRLVGVGTVPTGGRANRARGQGPGELSPENERHPLGLLKGTAYSLWKDLKSLWSPLAYGLLLGGALGTLGLSKGWVAPAEIGGGGWTSQSINALLGIVFSLATFMSPVGNLFVGTYLWKVGIAQAGFVSFLYASAASPQRIRLYIRLYGRRAALGLTLSLLLAALAAGLVVASLFRLLGLSIHYKLISGQML